MWAATSYGAPSSARMGSCGLPCLTISRPDDPAAADASLLRPPATGAGISRFPALLASPQSLGYIAAVETLPPMSHPGPGKVPLPTETRSAGMQNGHRLRINEFRRRYRLRSPAWLPSPSEKRRLSEVDGLRALCNAPACMVLLGTPPYSRTDQGKNRYFRVIDANGIPYIHEFSVRAICNNLPKHTNLTGGGKVYLGGELWFVSPTGLYVSGGSGRYPPINRDQLDCAVRVFRDLDYDVISLGWDEGTGGARRYREENT